MLFHRRPSGFTLAELLIALVILGVIATFTIPKVLQSQADSKKKAILKETIAAISNVMAEGLRDGQLDANPRVYFRDHLNVIKTCTTNVVTQGCWVSPVTCGGADFGQAYGFVLANGATMSDFDVSSAGITSEGVIIDWNGALPPNTEGDDQIAITLQYQTVGSFRAGTFRGNTNCAASTAYFNDVLWKN